MNLILCGENCRHQNEGYCALDTVAPLTSGGTTVCGYYEDRDKKVEDRGEVRTTEENREPLSTFYPLPPTL